MLGTKSQRELFNNLFSSLDSLAITERRCNLMPYVPVSILFNKDANNGQPLHTLSIDGCKKSPGSQNHLNKFFDNYTKYFNDDCDGDINKIRSINTLELVDPIERAKKACMTFSPNYKILTVGGGRLRIENNGEFYKIFHSNLERLELGDMTKIEFSHTVRSLIDPKQFSNLKTLNIEARNSYLDSHVLYTWKNVANMGLFQNVEKIIFSSILYPSSILPISDQNGFLRDIFKYQHEKAIVAPNLKLIEFIKMVNGLPNEPKLDTTSFLLSHLIQYFKPNEFVECIKIEWKSIGIDDAQNWVQQQTYCIGNILNNSWNEYDNPNWTETIMTEFDDQLWTNQCRVFASVSLKIVKN